MAAPKQENSPVLTPLEDSPNTGDATLAKTNKLAAQEALAKLGSHGKTVVTIQKDLKTLNYSVGPCGADGKFGPATQNAALKFETDHAQKVDGVIEKPEAAKLHQLAEKARAQAALRTPIIRYGTSGEIVKQVQSFLQNNDYDIGKKGPDGKFGGETLAALNQWRVEHGLPESKDINLESLKAMGIELRAITADMTKKVSDWEGYYPKAKLCPGGELTIGRGHTKNVKWGQTTTPQEADAFLKEDLDEAALMVQNRVTRKLTQKQFDALTSFTFNLGPAWMYNGSRLFAAIEKGDFEKANEIMKQYKKADGRTLKGLVDRRIVEAGMLLDKSEPEEMLTKN